MPASLPQRVSRSRYALLAWAAIALAILPGRSAEAVSRRDISQVYKGLTDSGASLKNEFLEPVALPVPVADVLDSWSFEGVTTTNTGTLPVVGGTGASADSGVLTGGSAFTGLHASSATIWTNPVGNGSAKSVSSDHWGVGDYYQFSFSTSGYTGITITWDQTGSNTGPRDFKVQYSIDGSAFTDASGTNSTYAVTNDSWSGSGSPKTVSRRTLDLSGVGTLTNQSAVYIRLVCNSTAAISGTLGTGGTDRVDNFVVNGTAQGGTPTPTPTPTDPSGTGSANPASVLPGGSTLLSVNVTPGTNPTSTGLAVTADLSLIGGS